MQNCLPAFTKWILGLFVFFTAINLSAQQEVRDGFCDYALDIDCGIAITNQTTVDGANVIWDYPQCNNYTFSGPEKVYKFSTTASGTIQVDLSIHASNLDLDILLLTDNCDIPTCIAQSITSNRNYQTEQIIYENAPVGDYYIIVDSEKDVGAFDLLVTCSTTPGCNLEYTVKPSAEFCGGIKGYIDVDISWGTAPFKIEWDNAYNTLWNTYTTNEKKYRISDLPTGTYVVKVTDVNGCTVMKNGILVGDNSKNLNVQFSATDAPCGSDFGWLNVDVMGSSPPYWVTVSGPKSGTVQITSNTSVIKDMPIGNYEITVEKGSCTKTGWATIDKADNLDFKAEVSDASCGGKGAFWITIQSGEPTYTIEWWHKDGDSDWMQANKNSFAMDNMKPGEYTIKITDRNGCWKSKKMVMGSGKLDFELESNAASCSSKGSVWVTINKGTPGYTVEWTGPSDGWKTTNDHSFAINDLQAGNYEISIKDAKGCTETKWVTVENKGGVLDFDLEANGASCGGSGAIWVTIHNGHPNYTVEWWGPGISKWASTANNSFQLKDLPKGEYTVKITDSKGCSNIKQVWIQDLGGGLDFSLESIGATCGSKGALWIDIKNGTPKFSVDVTGPGVNKWFEASSSKIQVSELPAGNYTVEITDAKGCKGKEYITIEDKGGSLDFDSETVSAGCGKNGQIWVTIKNGTAKYSVDLTGPDNASFWAETASKSFKLSGLEKGEYTLTITDKNGCTNSKNIWVDGGSDMDMDLEVNNASCTDDGRIWVTIKGGTPQYHLIWEGPTSGDVYLNDKGYQINHLKPGEYNIKVKDYYGCVYNKWVTVYGSTNNLKLRLEANNATCSQKGYIWANIDHGVGPYEVSWTGAASGSMNVNSSGFQISNLIAGNYTIWVKDKNGCEVSKTITIYNEGGDVDFDLEANNGSCGQNGYVWVTIKSGSGPYHISWTGPKNGEASSGSEGYQMSDLPGGWYEVTIKDKNGCTSKKGIEVSGGSPFTITTQKTDAICGTNGEIWVDMHGGKAPFSLSLSGPMVGSTTTNGHKYHFPNLIPGSYTLKVKDDNGCHVEKYITIGNNGGAIQLTAEKNDALCGNKGSIWLTMSGGTTPYKISWTGPVSSNAETTSTGYQLNNLPAGTYDIKVEDAYGCYTEKSITIDNIGNNLNLSLEANSASCGQAGSIWVTISGGDAPYTVEWKGPSVGSASVSGTGYQITGLGAGTYAVTVRDKNGCEVSKSKTIASAVQDFSITVAGTDVHCGQKGAIKVTMNGGSPDYQISWTGPSSGSASTGQGNYNIENLAAGTYTVTVKEYSGCEDTKTVVIYNKSSNISLGLEANSASCGQAGSIWVTLSGGDAPYIVEWKGPSAGSASVAGTGYQITGLSAGTYTVTAKDKYGCEVSKSVSVGSTVQDFSIALAGTDGLCGQKGSIKVTMNGGSPDYQISWTGPSSSSASTGQGNYNIENLAAGTYTVTVKEYSGCEATKTITIYDKGSNIDLTLEATDAACDKKGAIWATTTGGTAGFSFSWSGPVSGSTSTSQSGYNIENLPAGDYTVTVRDVNGCETTESVRVNNKGGALSISASTVTSVACSHEGTVAININGGTAPYTISYTGPTTGSVTATGKSYQLTGLQPGSYNFMVTDANGCSGTKKVLVEDNGSDLAVSLTATNISCGGKGTLKVDLTGGLPNYQINWYGGGLTGNINTGNSSVVLTDLPAGSYTVEVKDGIGCFVKVSENIINTGGDIGLQLVPKNDVCGKGGSIEVRIDGGAADYQIEWTGPMSGSATSASDTYQITGLSPGNYNVVVKDATGCEAKEWVGINASGNVNFNLVTTDKECTSSGNILVNITSGAPDYIISWSGPTSGSQTISTNVYRIENLGAGTYTVTVKDNKGCEDTQSTTVNDNGSNLGLTLTNTNASCGVSNGNITATVSGGQAPYTYSWTGPVSGSENVNDDTYSIWDLPSGNYTISVKDNKGCFVNKSIQVGTVGNNLGLNVVGKNGACGQLSSIQVTISNGTPNFKIEWNGPSTGEINIGNNSYTINGVQDGQYTVRVTDASGCSKAQAVIIQSNNNDVSFTYETKDATCDTKGAIWLTIKEGVSPYNIEWSGPSSGSTTSTDSGVQITDLTADVYAVTVRDKNGCVITQSIEVKGTNTGGSAVNFAFKPGTVTCNKNGDILLTMISGTAPYTVTWTGPSSGSRTASSSDITIENLTVGIYTVTVSGAGGCGSFSQIVEVEDKRVVLGVNGSVMNGVCGGKGSVQLSWSGDRDPYTVSWSGAVVGSFAVNGNSYTVSDLPTGNYTFKVVGYDGCEGQYQASVDNGGTTIVANFTYSVSAKTLTFSNTSSEGTYRWDFGDGNTSTEMNPTHTYAKNGTYNICLKVTNDCGTEQYCQFVSINAVTSEGPSAKVVLGEKSGKKGAVLQLPVKVEHCTKLGTLSGTIMMSNSQVAKINGISPSAISPIYNDANHSFSYLSAGGGMDITSETILFYINVQLTGGVGESSTIDLSSLPVALELTCTENGFTAPMTPEVESGRVSVSTNQSTITDVGGTIKTFWGDGIAEAEVKIESQEHAMNSMTAVTGEYAVNDVPMGYEYTFAPSKTTNPGNGLSTFGLFLTQKYILGYAPKEIVSPYQIIAMDANCSGTLTTFDLFAMQQMIVGNITEFPGCDSWVFVDASHEFPIEFDNRNVFPYPNFHTMMLESENAVADFIGVKVGDILGRAIPNDSYIAPVAEDRNLSVMPIQLANKRANAGETFEVAFKSTAAPEMVSFQMALEYDRGSMELVEFVPTEGSFGDAQMGINRNHLKVSWFDSNGKGVQLAQEEALFTLKFVAKKNILDILSEISINNRTFVSELHTQSNTTYRFKLESQSLLNSTLTLYQNTPNPFKDFTTITIEAAKSQDAALLVHDQFGRTIRTIPTALKPGLNQVRINRNDLSAGIYYYTIKAGEFTNTKRMLIVE